jgi:elongation factor Ts
MPIQITAQMVKQLREATNAGMMDCKNALSEIADQYSDEKAVMEAAIDELRKRGIAKAAKRLDRETSEGRIVTHVNENHILMLSVTCETDFVAINDDFGALTKEILDHALAADAADLEAFLASEKNGQAVSEFLKEKTGSIGEKIEVKHYINLKTDNHFAYYVHFNNKVATIVEYTGAEDEIFAKDVAMHAAAMKPIALDRTAVSEETLAKEKEIIAEQLRQEGKPEDMIEKISMGKINRFYKDYCLVDQTFVKSEDNKSVGAEAKAKGLELKSFVRFAIGE